MSHHTVPLCCFAAVWFYLEEFPSKAEKERCSKYEEQIKYQEQRNLPFTHASFYTPHTVLPAYTESFFFSPIPFLFLLDPHQLVFINLAMDNCYNLGRVYLSLASS